MASGTACPCGHGPDYARCCQPLHQGLGQAVTAGQLMRSRYSAFVLGLEDYLLASWHPATRPDALHLSAQQPAPRWLGLSIRETASQDADHATVEFVARYRLGGASATRLHERSRFERIDGRWYYLDGDIFE